MAGARTLSRARARSGLLRGSPPYDSVGASRTHAPTPPPASPLRTLCATSPHATSLRGTRSHPNKPESGRLPLGCLGRQGEIRARSELVGLDARVSC